MTYVIDTSSQIKKIFKKLEKRDKRQLEIIDKKPVEILENPQRFKHLRGDMKGSCRVHIDKSFVLTFEVDEENKVVRLLDYEHHDNIY